MRRVNPVFVLLAMMLTMLALPGCSVFAPDQQVRGNPVDREALAELMPGISTRADAQSLLGSPTAKASFNDNRWIYIGQMTEPVIAGTNAIMRQDVVVLTFDEKGVLNDVQTIDKKNALPVTMVSRATPTPGASTTLFDQIYNSIGMVNPLAGLGATPGMGMAGVSGTGLGGAP